MDLASATQKSDGSLMPHKEEVKSIWAFRRFLMHLGLAQHQPDAVRLATDVASLRAWVEARGDVCPCAKPRSDTCLRYLTLACDAVDRHNVASGYEYLHIADREAIFLMTTTERKVRAQSLKAEAGSTKFANSWRVKAILSLLETGRTESPKRFLFCRQGDTEILPEALAEAVAHQNTLVRNDHRKTDKTRWQLAWLGFIVWVLVLIAFCFAIKVPLPDDLQFKNLLPICIYLGLLGGFVSSAITQRTADRKTRVPEIEVSFYAALARGALGAATSIPVYILFKAGLIHVGSAADKSAGWGLLLLCFLAGFSERWFLSSVTSVAGDDKKGGESR